MTSEVAGVAGGRGLTRTISIHFDVEVPASRRDLFAYLSDLRNNPSWNWAVREVTPIGSGVPREGTRYRQERTTPDGGQGMLEITALGLDEHLEVRGDIEEGQITYRHDLKAMSRHVTRLLTTVLLDPVEPPMRQDLYTARLGAAISANLETLRSRFRVSASARPPSRG